MEGRIISGGMDLHPIILPSIILPLILSWTKPVCLFGSKQSPFNDLPAVAVFLAIQNTFAYRLVVKLNSLKRIRC